MSWEIVQSWLDGPGFAVLCLIYIVLLFCGYGLLSTHANKKADTTGPKKSIKPLAIMTAILVVFGILGLFGSVLDWVSFEFGIASFVISATMLLVIIYYIALV